jgi:NAD(P)H dehydrogenase (quinone)
MMSDPATPAPFTQPTHLVVLGHPDPDSFCASVARAYCDEVVSCGHDAVLRDLYSIGFDPLLRADERPGEGPFSPAADVAAELDLLRQADMVTLVYPLWFGMPPAIIKGYIDRVLGAGFSAGAIKTGAPHPLLDGKQLMLFTSSASTRPWLEEKGQWTALRHAFETYLEAIFGLRDAGHTHFDTIVAGAGARFIEECLTVVRERARAVTAKILSEKRARQSQAIRHGK